jgi:hypothetical protein
MLNCDGCVVELISGDDIEVAEAGFEAGDAYHDGGRDEGWCKRPTCGPVGDARSNLISLNAWSAQSGAANPRREYSGELNRRIKQWPPLPDRQRTPSRLSLSETPFVRT